MGVSHWYVDRQVCVEELVAHCRHQLASFKLPKRIVFLDELPKNPSGKILKRELRTLAAVQ